MRAPEGSCPSASTRPNGGPATRHQCADNLAPRHATARRARPDGHATFSTQKLRAFDIGLQHAQGWRAGAHRRLGTIVLEKIHWERLKHFAKGDYKSRCCQNAW